VAGVRKELFQPTEEGEARILLLIGAFSGEGRCLEGRTKLAKLDFLLRYPRFLRRALKVRGVTEEALMDITDAEDIESRMVRYRYGPWDPSYYALLGRLIGKRLVEPIPFARGIGYRATNLGQEVIHKLVKVDDWNVIALRVRLLRKKLDLSGTNLVRFIYDNFPEVSGAQWGTRL
jgi:hypothetical protein